MRVDVVRDAQRRLRILEFTTLPTISVLFGFTALRLFAERAGAATLLAFHTARAGQTLGRKFGPRFWCDSALNIYDLFHPGSAGLLFMTAVLAILGLVLSVV